MDFDGGMTCWKKTQVHVLCRVLFSILSWQEISLKKELLKVARYKMIFRTEYLRNKKFYFIWTKFKIKQIEIVILKIDRKKLNLQSHYFILCDVKAFSTWFQNNTKSKYSFLSTFKHLLERVFNKSCELNMYVKYEFSLRIPFNFFFKSSLK